MTGAESVTQSKTPVATAVAMLTGLLAAEGFTVVGVKHRGLLIEAGSVKLMVGVATVE